jgi:hypothetical protein
MKPQRLKVETGGSLWRIGGSTLSQRLPSGDIKAHPGYFEAWWHHFYNFSIFINALAEERISLAF